MQVILIRHSIRETYDETDCGITVEGIKLVEDRMTEVKKFITNDNNKILVSPFKRTIETGLCIAGTLSNITIEIEPILHEALLNSHMIVGTPLPLFKYLNKEKNLNSVESWNDIRERSEKILDTFVEKMEENTNLIAVTHGGIINMIIDIIDPNFIFNVNMADPKNYVPAFCDYAILSYDNSKWSCVYRNF
jgi:broad specificity phosphatase PhoE